MSKVDEVALAGNVAAFVAMLVAAVSWVAFGGRWAGAALAMGTCAGVFLFSLMMYQVYRHHSRNQPREGNGRWIPVKERGETVGAVRVPEE